MPTRTWGGLGQATLCHLRDSRWWGWTQARSDSAVMERSDWRHPWPSGGRLSVSCHAQRPGRTLDNRKNKGCVKRLLSWLNEKKKKKKQISRVVAIRLRLIQKQPRTQDQNGVRLGSDTEAKGGLPLPRTEHLLGSGQMASGQSNADAPYHPEQDPSRAHW